MSAEWSRLPSNFLSHVRDREWFKTQLLPELANFITIYTILTSGLTKTNTFFLRVGREVGSLYVGIIGSTDLVN